MARALAAPKLRVAAPAKGQGPGAGEGSGRTITLPRAELLLLGGDLAYPNPSK
jgi:hypothetical protein